VQGRNEIFPVKQVAAVALLLLSGGVALAQSPAPPGGARAASPVGGAVVPRSLDVPDGALVAPGKAPELDLLYTGDVLGYIDPCG
jgi:hypothetical protein